MSAIQHILFDLHGTLVDSARLRLFIADEVGRMMAARYGQDAKGWAAAYARIQADWHSYFADLHLSGDEGMANLREGLFRTTRALFRLMDTPEPDMDHIHALATTLASESARVTVAVLFDDVLPMLADISQRDVHLHVCSDTFAKQARTLLESAGIADQFEHVFGMDTLGQLDRDAAYYDLIAGRCGTSAGVCLVVDDDQRHVRAAKASGLQAVHLARTGKTDTQSIRSLADLSGWMGN